MCTPQDQFNPGSVAPVEDTLLSFGTAWTKELFLLVIADLAGGDAQFFGELADCPDFLFVFHVSLIFLLEFVVDWRAVPGPASVILAPGHSL